MGDSTKISIYCTMNQAVSWDSQMNAQRLKKGMDYSKTIMYWFDYSRDIIVEEEQQTSNTLDKAILHYAVRDGDKAYFSKEYVPVGIPKAETKKPDITAILESSAERKVKWYIYDLKGTVMQGKTAMKLCNQWHSGIEHIEGRYLNGLDGYSIESSLGVIYRYLSKEMLQKEKDSYVEKINQPYRDSLLTARKSRTKLNEYRQKVKAIQFILDGIFIDDEVSGNRVSYDIHYICMNTADKITYTAEMDIKF